MLWNGPIRIRALVFGCKLKGRNLLSIRLAFGRALLRLAFHVSRSKRLYEPVQIANRNYPGKRDADTRWQAIAGVLAVEKARSVLDVGCAEGWFLRRAADEFGCFAIGVDASHRRVQAGEIARLHDGADRVAVMTATLTPRDIELLPRVHVVLCLSVVHHVIREGGLAAAEDFVRALATRAEKSLIFEMGTADEEQLSWTKILPAMKEGQEKFVTDFLARSGLTNIRVIACTPGLKGDADRLLMHAVPQHELKPDTLDGPLRGIS